MYTTHDSYYDWLKIQLPIDNEGNVKGKKFFTCDISNKFKFVYWVFIPKEIEKKR